jgi:DNA-binding NarL/FixJ family response regulator
VLIASGDAVTCASLRQRLQEGGCTVVGHAGSEDAVLAAIETGRPEVVLLHVPTPAGGALRLARRLRSWHPGVAVVAFSAAKDPVSVLAAVDAGARGYVLSDDEPFQLVSAVRAVLEGGAPLSPKVARALIDARTPAGPERLTAREREVLGLLSEGLPNKAIAARLGISERTVKAHLTSAFRRLGVQRRTQAAMWVRAQRRVGPPGRSS